MDDPGLTENHFLRRLLTADTFYATFQAIREFLANVEASQVLAIALRWCEPVDPAVRAAGLDVLGALVRAEGAGPVAELLHQVRRVPSSTASGDLRWSAAHAIAGLRAPDVLPELLRFEDDPDADVRWQVV